MIEYYIGKCENCGLKFNSSIDAVIDVWAHHGPVKCYKCNISLYFNYERKISYKKTKFLDINEIFINV